MNVKELMLNDLVLLDNRVCKIVATNAYRDCVELIDISDEDNEVIGKYAKHISPIPLTYEILQLNGFVRYGDHCGLECTDDEWYNINVDYLESIDIDTASFRYSGLCSSVNELQRALRCCGLNELANNFKVK